MYHHNHNHNHNHNPHPLDLSHSSQSLSQQSSQRQAGHGHGGGQGRGQVRHQQSISPSVHSNSPLEGSSSRPSLSPSAPAAHALASLARSTHNPGSYPPHLPAPQNPQHPQHPGYQHHQYNYLHQHGTQQQHTQHNPYPPISSAPGSAHTTPRSRVTSDHGHGPLASPHGQSQQPHGQSQQPHGQTQQPHGQAPSHNSVPPTQSGHQGPGTGPGPRPGRPTSAVLAALASSDLEYPGIMRPAEPLEYENKLSISITGAGGPSRSLEHPHRGAWESGQSSSAASTSKPFPVVKAEEKTPPTKKRRRKGAPGPATDVPEDAEVEYADPDGDTTRGPVFVHPPKGTVQACVRCHRIKRKCDGALPRCASCTRADVPCVFELSAAASTYVHTLKDKNAALTSNVEAAQARIAALEEQLQRGGSNGHDSTPAAPASGPRPTPTPTQVASVANLVGPPLAAYSGEFARVTISALQMKEHATLGMERRAPSRVRSRSLSPVPEPITDLLSHADALRAAKMYFDFNALPYPLLDKAETLATIDEMYGVAPAEDDRKREPIQRATDSSTNSDTTDESERRQFLAGMVLAIGAHASARAGDLTDTQLSVPERIYRAALKNRTRAIERENLICVQALCLQALWTMSNPGSGSIWQLVGLAARVITAIGLHRRAEPNVTPAVAERRRRVFWAFYNIDRILAPTLCKPLAISEEDIDIELPTQGPEDGAFRGIELMWLTRHVIRYRGLMGRILTELYSVNGVNNNKPEPERIAIVHRLHTELDGWIVDCPFPADQGPGTPKANYSAWWQIHYNHGLCTLYRPSPLYPDTTPETLRALYDASSRCVDLYLDMYQVNKTSFHLLQIIALFVSCISLLCCLCECDARMRAVETDPSGQTVATLAELGLGRYSGADDPAWAAEIRSRVSQCQSLFDAFGHHIPASARYRDTFFRISELLLARYGPLEKGDGAPAREQAPPAGQGMQEQQQMSNSHLQRTEAPLNAGEPPAYAPVMDVTPTGLVPQVAPGEKAPTIPGVDDMAGAWDAMTQLWFDLGDMFGDESDPFATLDGDWAGEWGQGGVGAVGGVGGMTGVAAGVGGGEMPMGGGMVGGMSGGMDVGVNGMGMGAGAGMSGAWENRH